MPLKALSSSSLATRLFFASVILLPLLLWFSATMLNHAFKRNLQLSEKETLNAQLNILLGVAEVYDGRVEMPPVLAVEPRFGVANSGLYAWILNERGEMQWRSQSMELISQRIFPALTKPFEAGRKKFIELEMGQEGYSALYIDTVWGEGTRKGFRFVVAHSEISIDYALMRYRYRLFKWLGGLAVMLIIVQSLIARWGLLPLRYLATELKRVEDGLSEQLQGDYPADIRPITENLNAVLSIEREQRERYRNNLSDLAHSLKTPLSVVRGELERKQEIDGEQLALVIEEQVERMSSIIDHQLRRASAQVTHASHLTPVRLNDLVQRITRALEKVYRQKGVIFYIDLTPNISVVVEEADMMELLGNLIENACKYGKGKVGVSAHYYRSDIVIEVDDDGAGVPNNIRKSILVRGARSDTANAGQGLGLALAVDIVSGYSGGLEIGSSHLGGAKFRLRIPKRRAP